jgi:2-polyprenyl-3-methyl-5-hydroxy-6-metoxy-1,4-benzoquinol methylase
MDVPNDAVIEAWSRRAHPPGFSEEGDFARIHLLNPALFSLLGDVRGQRVLDAGCGQGYLARILTHRGASVTGIGPAEGLVRYAIERDRIDGLGIDELPDRVTSE